MNTFNPENTPYIEKSLFDGSVPAELSGDYILPDVYSDVKKILNITASPILTSRFVSGKRLEFSGGVDYRILFSTDTDEGECICSVHFAAEWNSSVGELEGLEYADILIVPKIASCTVRPSNPRKLSVKCTVSSDVRIAAKMPCPITVIGAVSREEELSLEKRTETAAVRSVNTFAPEPLRISQDIELDPSLPSIDRIVSCRVNIYISESKPRMDTGAVNIFVKGSAFVNCLYKAAGQNVYRSFARTVPFTHTIDAEDCTEQFKNCVRDSLISRVTAVPVEINAVVGNDSYGEPRIVELDFTSELTARLFGTQETALTLDAYSTARESVCDFVTVSAAMPPKLINTNFTVGELFPAESVTVPDGAVIVDGAVSLDRFNINREHGHCALTSTAAVSCIYTDAEGSVGRVETVLPVRCEINAGDITDNTDFLCEGIPSDLRLGIRDGRLSADFEVSLSAEVWDRSEKRVLNSVTLADPRNRQGGSDIILCYPSPKESLWDVAKRYGTSVAAIEASNRGGRVIMIPTASPRSFVV